MRQQLYTLINKAEPGDHLSKIYDIFIVIVALISMLPLMFKESNPYLDQLDIVTVYILFIDYILRWITHDFRSGKKGIKAFLIYPFTPIALLNFISLLPSMGLIGQGFRILRMLRIFVIFNYSKHAQYIIRVFKKESKTLLSVLWIAVFYIFISALAVFVYEPDTFDSFFEALYWSTTALTTVGYGDISPISDIGRLVSMVSSLFGIAIIAMPAGIITAGFMEELNRNKEKEAKPVEQMELEQPPIKPKPLRITKNGVRYFVVMIIGVTMNVALGTLARYMNWPLWLDVSGTAMAALVLEPAAGLIVGLVDNMVLAISQFGAGTLVYYAVSAAVALIVGLCMRWRKRHPASRIVITIILVILVSSVLSACLDTWVYQGQPPVEYWERVYYDQAMAGGLPHILSYFWGAFVIKIFDTAATALIVAGVYFLLPKKWRSPLNA